MGFFDEVVGAITLGVFEIENAFMGTGSSCTTSGNENKFVSKMGDTYCPKEVKDKLKAIYHSNTRTNISDYQEVHGRAIDGWRISAHVCAYLSCKEGLHDDKWNKEYKKAANVICREFGIPDMYKDVSVGNLKMKDYGINSGRPIILASTVAEAMRRFPCESFIKSMKKKEVPKREVVKPSEVITKDNKVILLPCHSNNNVDDTSKDKDNITNIIDEMEFTTDNIESIVSDMSDRIVDEMEYTTKKIDFFMNSLADRIVDEMNFTTERMESMITNVLDQAKDDNYNSEDAIKAIIGGVTDKIIRKLYNLIPDNNTNTENSIVNIIPPISPSSNPPTASDLDKDEGTINDTEDKEDNSGSNNSHKSLPKSPIIKIHQDKFVIKQENEKLTPAERKRFDKTFGKFLSNRRFNISKIIGGAIECTITNGDNTWISYIIDPCLAIGDDYYVMVPTVAGSTIMVHPSEKEIMMKIFNSQIGKYVLTIEEHQRALSHLFLNLRIYNVFDMSNMGSNILKLKRDPASFKKFGRKLTFIINCIDNTSMLGRLRFSRYGGIDDFEVRSDNSKKYKVRSPFPGETLDYLSGVIIQVSGDNVKIIFDGVSAECTIEDYGII